MGAAPRLADGVTPRAERVEQFLAVLLFAIGRACRSVAHTGQQQCQAKSVQRILTLLCRDQLRMTTNARVRSARARRRFPRQTRRGAYAQPVALTSFAPRLFALKPPCVEAPLRRSPWRQDHAPRRLSAVRPRANSFDDSVCRVRPYQRDVAFPNAYNATSAMVTLVEKIRILRSQSILFASALLNVSTAKRAFSANRRIGVPRIGGDAIILWRCGV